MGVDGQRHAPTALPPGKTRYPLYRRLGGPQRRSGRVGKISPPPEFDPRTVLPVASRYTDWAIPALIYLVSFLIRQTRSTMQHVGNKYNDLKSFYSRSFALQTNPGTATP